MKKVLKRLAFYTYVLTIILGGLACASEPIIYTIAGTGKAELAPTQSHTSTNIGNPFGVEATARGELYICEVSNHRLWKLDTNNNALSVVAGTGRKGLAHDGTPALEADLNEPYEVRIARNGDIYFVEMQNHVVRRIDAKSGLISTVAGNGNQGYRGDSGPATSAMLNRPHSIALDGKYLYVADIGNHRIRRVDLDSNKIETFAGTAEHKLPIDGSPVVGTPVLGPRALFIEGRTLWVALREGHSVWRINLERPVWRHVSGTGKKGYSGDGGPAAKATFNGPKGIAVANDTLYVVDTENQAIRTIDLKTNVIETLAGVGPHGRGFRGESESASKAYLNRPHGVCIDSKGNVYIGDSENHRVRVVTADN